VDLKFIDRVIKATLILAAVFFPLLSVYIGVNIGLSVLLGAVWGSLNLLAIKYIVVFLLPGPERKPLLGIIILLVKLPVLYLIGYFLITWKNLSIPALLWGFSSIFLVALLKVLGRLYLGMDNTKKAAADSTPKEMKA
jgi:hypothetical protein